MNIPVFEGQRIVAVAGVGNKLADYDERDMRQLQLLMDGWWRIVVNKQFELNWPPPKIKPRRPTRQRAGSWRT